MIQFKVASVMCATPSPTLSHITLGCLLAQPGTWSYPWKCLEDHMVNRTWTFWCKVCTQYIELTLSLALEGHFCAFLGGEVKGAYTWQCSEFIPSCAWRDHLRCWGSNFGQPLARQAHCPLYYLSDPIICTL